jgi:hypothetical protein
MIKKKPAPEFLVVYEDIWNNKHSYRTRKIGTTIVGISKDFNVTIEDGNFDKERYDSDTPYQVGTFGLGFYDIECYEQEEGDAGLQGEYAGRIMIFQL